MDFILIAAVWIGIFVLTGIALNLLTIAVAAIIGIPIQMISYYKEKKRNEQLAKVKAIAAREFLKMMHEDVSKENSDKAYTSAVSKVSTRKKK